MTRNPDSDEELIPYEPPRERRRRERDADDDEPRPRAFPPVSGGLRVMLWVVTLFLALLIYDGYLHNSHGDNAVQLAAHAGDAVFHLVLLYVMARAVDAILAQVGGRRE